MAMNKNNQSDAAIGDYDCWAASNVVQIATIQGGRNAGEVKAIVSLHADVGGTVELVEVWLTLDPDAETAKGKKRISFTIDAFNGIGASNALAEIGAALEADPGCSSVRLSGVLDADNKATTLATLHVSESSGYTNYDLWAKRKPAPKGLASKLTQLGQKNGGKAASAGVNPFAAKPEPASHEDTSFDPVKLSAPAARPQPAA